MTEQSENQDTVGAKAKEVLALSESSSGEDDEGRGELAINEQQLKMERHSWSGPLPPPSILKQYDLVSPGFAERIFNDFEQQTRHRQELERQIVNSRIQSSKYGQIFAFLIGLAGFVTT